MPRGSSGALQRSNTRWQRCPNRRGAMCAGAARCLLEIRKLTARKRGSRISTIRPGYPLGHRKKQIHEVDRVLSDCCYFLRELRKEQDTS